MKQCTASCCPLVQIKPFRHSFREKTAFDAWTMFARRRLSAGARERARWRGHRRPLPGGYRSTSAIDRVEGPQPTSRSAINWSSHQETPSLVDEPRTSDQVEWDWDARGEFAGDEHRGICPWPPRGYDADISARRALELALPPAFRNILDPGGLTVTSVRKPCRPIDVGMDYDPAAHARAAREWTRKWGHRVTSDDLTDRELAAFHAGQSARRVCGTHAVILERQGVGPTVSHERMAAPLRCGQRMCETCFGISRKVASEALKGHWSQFLTLTIDHQKGHFAHCWRNISKWASKFMRALTRAAKRGATRCRCGDHPEGTWPGTVRTWDGSLAYAWVVEPHRDMFPHVHAVLDSWFVCYTWIRRTWARITRENPRMVKMMKVGDVGGVCSYLVKYLTKAAFPDVILAILYRKRLWGRSLRPAIRREPGWKAQQVVKLPIVDGKPDVSALPASGWRSAVPMGNGGWKLAGKVEGKWIQWILTKEDLENELHRIARETVGSRDWWATLDLRGAGDGQSSEEACRERGELVKSRVDTDGLRRRSVVGRQDLELDSHGSTRVRKYVASAESASGGDDLARGGGPRRVIS